MLKFADKLCCKYTAKQKQTLSELNKKVIETQQHSET